MNGKLGDYRRKGYKKVGGYLNALQIRCICELSDLQKSNGIKGPVCEIGIHHGRLFILLHLLSEKDEHGIACDLFERQDENISISGLGDKDKFLENLDMWDADMDRIEIITENSLNLKPQDLLTHGALRMISVDGGHDAETAYNDIALAAETIVEGGIILLDDFPDPNWLGVSESLFRYLLEKERGLWPVAILDRKLILTNSGSAAYAYRDMLIDSFNMTCEMRHSHLLGKEVVILHERTPRKKLKKYLQERKLWKRVQQYRLVDEIGKIVERYF